MSTSFGTFISFPSTRGWESHWKRRRDSAGDHATHWCRDPGRLPVEPACFMPPWIEGIYVPNIFCWFVGISRSRELRLEIRGMQSVLFRYLAPKFRLKRLEIVRDKVLVTDVIQLLQAFPLIIKDVTFARSEQGNQRLHDRYYRHTYLLYILFFLFFLRILFWHFA